MTPLLTLSVDAATYVGTIALVSGPSVLAEEQVEMRSAAGEQLLPGIRQVLDAAGVTVHELQRVACGSGPGSFTSLRIAASTAKGLAAARSLPLVAVSSLALMAATTRAPGRYLTVLDAMRGDWFAAAYDVRADGGMATLVAASLRSRDAVEDLAASLNARLIGPREEQVAHPHARAFARLDSLASFVSPVDLETWEPDYGRHAEAQVRWERAHG
ncbi:MAG: tRNA (adenosine(37)-N6)-threonylcarbamoyltransferase complex dimerization subunit type 1 TsaB, partial [Gemmatimonadaceae bacterium]